MELVSQIRTATRQALIDLYRHTLESGDILVNETKPEFDTVRKVLDALGVKIAIEPKEEKKKRKAA